MNNAAFLSMSPQYNPTNLSACPLTRVVQDPLLGVMTGRQTCPHAKCRWGRGSGGSVDDKSSYAEAAFHKCVTLKTEKKIPVSKKKKRQTKRKFHNCHWMNADTLLPASCWLGPNSFYVQDSLLSVKIEAYACVHAHICAVHRRWAHAHTKVALLPQKPFLKLVPFILYSLDLLIPTKHSKRMGTPTWSWATLKYFEGLEPKEKAPCRSELDVLGGSTLALGCSDHYSHIRV